MSDNQINETGWQEFWRYTRTYFTLDGMADSADRICRFGWFPDCIQTALRGLIGLLVLILHLILVAGLMFPLSMLRMLWLTPRRFRLTVLARKYDQ